MKVEKKSELIGRGGLLSSPCGGSRGEKFFAERTVFKSRDDIPLLLGGKK